MQDKFPNITTIFFAASSINGEPIRPVSDPELEKGDAGDEQRHRNQLGQLRFSNPSAGDNTAIIGGLTSIPENAELLQGDVSAVSMPPFNSGI